MKVKVTWLNNNLFVRTEHYSRMSYAELDNETPFETIEEFAKEATPEGFWLQEISYKGTRHIYFVDGKKRVEEVK